MPEPSLFDAPTDNRGLFSDHYLEERFSERSDVKALQEEAGVAFERIYDLWRERLGELEGANEAQTEDRFVQPVLEEMGWARQVQASTQNLGQRSRPDYALFTSEKVRREAVETYGADGDGLYSRAEAFAEAKRWGRPLGRGGKEDLEGGDAFSKGTPALQVVGYFVASGLDWGLLTNGARWRLYYAGAPSRMDTYYEVNLEHIFRLAGGSEEEEAEARGAFLRFYALFRVGAFEPSPPSGEPFVEDILEASNTFGAELEEGLKERIYDDVFLKLARGLYESLEAEKGEEAADEALQDIYQATLRLLYRLLFLLYAEARGLLPIRDELGYFQYSLTRITTEATQAVEQGRVLSRQSTDLWNDLESLFAIVNGGDPDLDVPEYNGSLFRLGKGPNEFLDTWGISDKRLVPALVALTRQGADAGGTQVDYKALDVRQLGSIYEGLLEHRLVKTEAGDLDLLTDEGERKETGSYYTPHYIVKHIVEETLEPVVDRRVGRFDEAMEELRELEGSNGDAERAEVLRQGAFGALFSLKVCDPAMGSGHFLVQATDYLADRFSDAIGRYPENPVVDRLEEIREEILSELERQGVELEDPGRSLSDTALLRRLVMKRCIYGVDLNPMAVELAKLSLWLRSFTVGAPLSFLDHHLRAGNSLVGASVGEVRGELEANGGPQGDLFDGPFSGLEEVTELMQGVARRADATLEEVQESAERFAEYETAAEPYRRALDVWTSRPFGNERAEDFLQNQGSRVLEIFRGNAEPKGEAQEEVIKKANRIREEHSTFHWELEFPEVYFDLEALARKDNPGFDAVVGNPPYVRMEAFKDLKDFLRAEYDVYAERTDLYGYFIEQALSLVADGQRLGFIVSNKWTRAGYGEPIRTLIEEEGTARQVIDFGDLPVFDATTYPLILIASKERRDEATGIAVQIPHLKFEDLSAFVENIGVSFTQEELRQMGWALLGNPGFDVLTNIQETGVRLVDYVGTSPLRGIVSGYNEAFIVDEETRDELIAADPSSEELLHPVRTGRDVRRYAMEDPGTYLIYAKHGIDIDQYPAVKKHLQQFKDDLEGRATDQAWFELQQPQEAYEDKFKQPKIINPDLAEKARFHLDHDGIFPTNKIYSLPTDDAYLLAVLNSQLSNFYLQSTSAQYRGDYLQLLGQYVEDIPIPEINATTPDDEREHHVEVLVDRYKAAQEADDELAEDSMLDAVEDHLFTEPERADVVHDLLATLARKMTDLKADRRGYNLDITKYVPEPSDEDGVAITEIGRYQPASGATDSILTATTDEREKLRIGKLKTKVEEGRVTVQASARFKPDEEVSESELDSYGYYETEPIDFCILEGCTDEEVKLASHWLDALNDADAGFAGFRGGAGKTISLRDRIMDIRFPDLGQRSNELAPFFRYVEEASKLDRQIEFTDNLIDQIVYRLYGLSDEEVEVVEGGIS